MISTRFLLVSTALTLALSACSQEDASNPVEGDPQNVTARNDFVTCPTAGSGTGNIQVFLLDQESKDQSTRFHTKVAAVGMGGKFGEDRIGFSQGDQPDVSAYEVNGHVHELKFLKKQCEECDNAMTLEETGFPNDDDIVFIDLESMTIDEDQKTLHIAGNEVMYGDGPDKPRTFDFVDCTVNQNTLTALKGKLLP